MRAPVFWFVVALILAATTGVKIALAPASDLAESELASQSVRIFVSAHSQTPVAPARLKPNVAIWSGWRFTTSGCVATAYPAPRNRELDLQILEHATAADRVAYVFRGEVRSRPPPSSAAWDYGLFRMLLPLGLANPQSGSYVILIHSAGCDAPEHLPWSRL